MTPPPGKQEPSTGFFFFDEMCHTQCATCRFIHINFCHLYIQRQACYFGNLLIMHLHSKRKKEKTASRWLGQVGMHGQHSQPCTASAVGLERPSCRDAPGSKGCCEQEGLTQSGVTFLAVQTGHLLAVTRLWCHPKGICLHFFCCHPGAIPRPAPLGLSAGYLWGWQISSVTGRAALG